MHHEFSNVIMAQCIKKKKKALRIFEKITWLEMEGKAGKYHFFGFRRKWEAERAKSFQRKTLCPQERDSVICNTPALAP